MGDAIADVLNWLESRNDIQSLRAAVCDLNGIMRGKRIPVEQARKALEGKLRMPYSLIGLDIWGEDIEGNAQVFSTGDADGLCHWTGRGILPVNWTAHPTALLPLWLADETGAPYLGDPRRALARILDRYAALGLTPVTATELEFYLVDPTSQRPVGPVSPVTGRRLDSDAALSIDEIDDFEAFIHDIYEACRMQGIPVDTAIAENGVGQFEINLNHVPDALRAADDAVLFKRTVKGIARKHGFAACFMAKPYGERAGNGFHVHFSVVDKEGRNIFDDGSDQGSETMRHAVGGLLSAMAESTLVFAPHFNSYRRLRPRSYAPTAVAWGYENRMVAIRIPGGPSAARRIEHRVSGADANPYLVLAAILGAALIGIERQLSPGEPTGGEGQGLPLAKLPPDWASAIAAFETGPRVSEIFPAVLRDGFIACKRQELNTFALNVSDFEIETYLESV
ncbi:glutamine synthetase [Mesorhizobium sp. M1C.F.Ca.ET.193.01.1.1]|uniref:glutamine synthetase family protein n=1 Tax=unclassified Mesorhizobium TaxID=325217 RepID=UPI000FD5BE3A|nr:MULTISPECIES: glutamine synthetase family protein [unclassified Mesorhizobium]TGS99113.1 glutamine synthetase [bacterium M00.F.Ca.ET.177.01.1.1]TGQ53318.1 glutamine synthetase [Mesorhizobium sp. M1C.F.Ca.ET.210.01.1.1]TGQ70586.1 glutamine synthetase [Mesorhizobium sp. M1C.F.Ca.ET.212.01.1.1]TGR07022.1 glutamine synthetase [Mesorhizobium sp. M1C.F.Ca.ET.204.01.1.1]TGR27594.1 glutamine synthetase [Mesorhizobium sp. M1C.F.Ca.ET.196.01.1.1]